MKSQSSIYSRYFTYIKPVGKLPIVRTYGSTIFTLLTMAIFIFFAIKPTVETILVLQKKIVNSSQVLDKITQKANNLTLAKKNYENLDLTIKNKISDAIPDTITLRSIIQSLEQTAKLHEASVSALQIQPFTIDTKDNKLGAIAEISFTFNIEGTYQNLISVLKDFNTSSRLLSIDSLTLSKLSDGSGLIMSISGKAYYIK